MWEGVLIHWSYRNTEYTQPLLNPIVDNWHQLNPYNTAVFDSLGNMAAVGCVPVAVGSLLSYYKKPNGLNYDWGYDNPEKFDFDWTVMLASPQLDNSTAVVAEMFAFLGNEKLLATIYHGEKDAETYISNVKPALIRLGAESVLFDNVDFSKDFDSISNYMLRGSIVKKPLYRLKYQMAPVLAYGEKEGDKTGNHTWVIDGVVKRRKYLVDWNESIIGPIVDGHVVYAEALPLWHCVWGQTNKKWDGWYAYLKDENKLDSIQYAPFANKSRPTGIKMYPVYKNWKIIGGCFPEKTR